MPAVDARFVREGRPLRDWLPQLTHSDPATRHAAENATSAMWWNAPLADANAFAHQPPDPLQHREDWGRAISQALTDPSFPGQRFVHAALDRMREAARERDELFDLEERWFDPPMAEEDVGARDPAADRALEAQVKAGHARANVGRLPNSFGEHTLHMVIEHAGTILLSMPGTVRAALRDRTTSQPMAKALERLGPAASAFAPDLLSRDDANATDASEGSHHMTVLSPAAIAAVGREDAATVRALLEIAKAPDAMAAYDARDALACMGPDAVRLVPSSVDELMAVAANDPDRASAMLPCLAALAPDRRDVFDLAVDAARPRSPEVRAYEGHPQYSYDAAMFRRGPAIEALVHFTPYAGEAVAVLTDAIDTFAEYDPDWDYERAEHGRVINALGRLGPTSAAAVRALIPHLRQQNGDLDWPVIRLLGQQGPAAREALPALRQLHDELKAADPDAYAGDEQRAAPDEATDGLAWAIWRVEGKSAGGQ